MTPHAVSTNGKVGSIAISARLAVLVLVAAMASSACATENDAGSTGSGIPVPEHYELGLRWTPGTTP